MTKTKHLERNLLISKIPIGSLEETFLKPIRYNAHICNPTVGLTNPEGMTHSPGIWQAHTTGIPNPRKMTVKNKVTDGFKYLAN